MNKESLRDIEIIITSKGLSVATNTEYTIGGRMYKLYNEIANIITKQNSDILEIGYGMGISSNYIHELKPKSHTIIEINKGIYQTALDWSKDKPNVNIILGDWIEILPKLNQKYDGILWDAFPSGDYYLIEDYVPKLSKIGTILCVYHPYPKFRNLNTYSKIIDNQIINWSVFDGKKFGTKSNDTKLI